MRKFGRVKRVPVRSKLGVGYRGSMGARPLPHAKLYQITCRRRAICKMRAAVKVTLPAIARVGVHL